MRAAVPRAMASPPHAIARTGCSCAEAPGHPNMTAKLAAAAAAKPPSRQPIIGVNGKAAMRQHYGNRVRGGAWSAAARSPLVPP
jgi:hypothetical protein